MYTDSSSWIWKFTMSVPWDLHPSGSTFRTLQFWVSLNLRTEMWHEAEKSKGSGYTNFVTHVQSPHPAEHSALLADLSIATSSQSKSADWLFYSKKDVRFMGGCNLLLIACNRFRLWKTQCSPNTFDTSSWPKSLLKYILKNWKRSLKRKFETYCQTYLQLFLVGGRPVICTTVKPHLLHIVGRPISYAISDNMQ